jgi:hypothetical protein
LFVAGRPLARAEKVTRTTEALFRDYIAERDYVTVPGGGKIHIDRPNHTRPLNSLMAIASEMARVYRSTINGMISTSDGARLIYQLKEIRAAREAINAEAILAIANRPPPPPGDVTINIMTIPANHFVTREQASADYDWKRELADAKVELAQLSAPGEETAGGLGNEDVSSASLEPAEPSAFANMTIEELKRMAGVDVDER